MKNSVPVTLLLAVFADNIEISNTSRNVTENACCRCHGDVVQAIDRDRQAKPPQICWR